MNIKPSYTLLTLLSILIILFGVSYFFPQKGIQLTDQLALKFENFSLTEVKQKEVGAKDISQIIALAEAKEQLSLNDLSDSLISLDGKKDTLQIKLAQTIEYDKEKKHPLAYFFQGLQDAKNNAKAIRVLHYGDSQIEADRISDYIRAKLQSNFGGSGIGMLPAVQISQTVGVKQYNSALWTKYNGYIALDKKLSHKNYGPLISFSNFVSDDDSTEEWLKITINKNAGANVSAIAKLKLFYGNSTEKCAVKLLENEQLIETDTLKTGSLFNIKQWRLLNSVTTIELKFAGKRSPDIYGLALEGDYGVQLDNIPLRGSSGTFFNQINLQHIKTFYDYLNVKLLILQFGGNALPAIDSEQKAKNYGDYLRSQILAIKKNFPDISILVVGPADMSIKDGVDYVSHPYIEPLRNSIKLAAKQTNSAFWDMYEAMGGKNSMPSWVNASPALAAKDYIHFSPTGARKIAVLLYDAMMKDYNNKKQINTEPSK